MDVFLIGRLGQPGHGSAHRILPPEELQYSLADVDAFLKLDLVCTSIADGNRPQARLDEFRW
eukprot:COSAG06_NODE_303_length_17863_cov_13.622326_6_plen_62_part_00